MQVFKEKMALTIKVKVVPSSGKSCWQLDKNGTLKCFLKSAPEKGAANKELIKTLSKQLKIPQQEIEIISGLTDRKKVLKIHTALTKTKFFAQVGIQEEQMGLTK
jgi:hypothetical protein